MNSPIGNGVYNYSILDYARQNTVNSGAFTITQDKYVCSSKFIIGILSEQLEPVNN